MFVDERSCQHPGASPDSLFLPAHPQPGRTCIRRRLSNSTCYPDASRRTGKEESDIFDLRFIENWTQTGIQPNETGIPG
jgi:hypothetical protein